MDTRIPAGLLLLALAGPASAADPPANMPPLQPTATQEHHAGKMIFAELVAPDLAASKRFYGSLFGWSFRDNQVGATDYATAWLGGRPVATLVGKALPADKSRQPAWLTFLSAPDVDGTVAAATQRDGRLLFPPHDIPNLGRAAVLADPEGAVFVVLASSSGDPPDALAQNGDWIWSSLFATDPEKAGRFYQAVLHDEVYDPTGEAEPGHLILASDDFARASINPLPPGQGHPTWLNDIRVADAAATVKQAEALGAKILVPPRVDRHGGRIAVLADPSGAPFGVMEWPDEATTGDAK